MLDFATCTECGRCQSVCPAWTTGKPLSPKLLVMGLRDNMFASADRLLSGDRPAATRRRWCPAIIDPDVLWSCTTCGAASSSARSTSSTSTRSSTCAATRCSWSRRFPSEAGLLLRNMENQGDPWGLGSSKRTEWIGAPRLRGARSSTGRSPPDVEYLYWVGCAGRARRARAQAGRVHRAHAAPRRRDLRDPGTARVLQRRPGAAHRQRVPLPGDGQGQRRDPPRGRARPRSSRPARTASTRSRTSTRRSAATSSSSTTPSC